MTTFLTKPGMTTYPSSLEVMDVTLSEKLVAVQADHGPAGDAQVGEMEGVLPSGHGIRV